MVARKIFNFVKSHGAGTLQTFCFIHLFSSHIFTTSICVGPSMLPTLNTFGDVVFFNKISLRFNDLVVGDLVSFYSPRDPKISACKRVIGLAGDTICVNPGAPIELRKYLTIPKGRIWVQGDNGSNSVDSRVYGPLPLGLVQAHAQFRLFSEFKDLRANIDRPFKGGTIREVNLDYLLGNSEE